MIQIRVPLTEEQRAVLRPLFNKAAVQASMGRRGMVLAQVYDSTRAHPTGNMRALFIDHDQAVLIAAKGIELTEPLPLPLGSEEDGT